MTSLSLYDADADVQLAFLPGNNAARGYTLNLRALPTRNLSLRFNPGAAGEPTVSGIEILPAASATAARPLAKASGAGLAAAVQLHPNPAREAATISLQTTSAQQVQVEVLDALGRRVAGFTHAAHVGRNELPLPVRQLPAGVYSVTVRRGA